MKNELLKIGSFTVYGYGLMIAVGILAAYFTGEYRVKKKRMDADPVFYLLLCCVAGGFAGAKVLYWMTEWKTILQDPGFLFRSLTDGFVVFGGILGGILGAYLYCRVRRLNFLKYFDALIPSVALAQGFGRIGCLLAGCCYGKETSGWFGITFTHSDFAPNGVSLVPTQIYASILDFLHFFLLLFVSRHVKAQGQVAGIYLLLYSVGRFFLEFYRGDLERGSIGVLSTSQFIAIFTAAAGIALYLAASRKRRSIFRKNG